MLISSLNSSSFTYVPATVNPLDTTGKLYKAQAPSPTQLGDNNGMATADVFIYSRMGLTAGVSAPSRGVVLENADGSYFKLDLGNNDKVNLVAKGGNIQLFVYRPDTTSAEKYVFDRKGVFTSAAELDAESFSAAEISTRRDLDNNGAVGAKLLTTQTQAGDDPITAGVSKATGGVFNVNVMGQDIYVVGNRIDRLKRIDASTITLKNADGSFWKPPAEVQTLRAVSTQTANGTTWEIFGTAAEDTDGDGFAATTKFSFGTDNKLSSTEQLNAEEVIAAEVSARKDLNVDGVYGLKIDSPIDSVGGLVTGKLAGQDVVLAKVASTDSTGGRAVGLDKMLLDVDGGAWKLPADASTAGYTLKSIVKDSATSAIVFATKSNGNDVLRFDFQLNANDRYEIDEDTAAGVSVTAQDMAQAERTYKRDLNGDNAFGAVIDPALLDKQTKLYKATMMGQEFYLAGDLDNRSRVTARSASAAQSLGGALLNTDGSAWEAKIGSTTYTVTAMLNTNSTAGSREYAVYAKAGSEIRKFEFTENADGHFVIDATKTKGEVMDDPVVLAALEKSTKRDLNGDSKFGATIDDKFDTVVGLYKATIGNDTYYLAGQDANNKIRTTGLTASLAQDLSGALLNADGTAWALPSAVTSGGYGLTSIVDTSSGGTNSYSVFATKNNGDNVLRFDFLEDANGQLKITSGTQAGVVLTAAEMAAAEDTHNRDLNQDAVYGANIGTTILDRTVGLYTATLMGQNFLLAGHESNGALRKTATNGMDAKALTGVLLNSDGTAWSARPGYTASSLVKTSAGNASPVTYELYTYKTTDKRDVLRHDFEEDSDGNFVVTATSVPGIAMSADAMALKEATLGRDLNNDNVYGVELSNTLDATGGLYQASALGGSFLLAGGPNLVASANAPLDLSKALLDNDGSAWSPDNVADVTLNKLSLVSTATAGTFTVFVENDAGSDTAFSAYDFVAYKQTGNRRDLSTEDLAAAEKTHGRDLSGDGLYGANITEGTDLVGGLYKGSLGTHTNVHFKASPGLALGSLVAANALDFTAALKTNSGYWSADTGFNARTAFSDGTDFVLIATNASQQVRRYTFDANNQLDLAKSGILNAQELATLEEAQGRDLNKDKVLAVRVNTTAVDAVGGLFSGNDGQNDHIIVANTASAITNLDSALLNADGSRWNPGSFDKLVLDTTSSGYDVYAKATSGGSTTYTRYSFGSDYKLTATSAPLTDVELGLAEASISRDINADNAVGAKVISAIDRNSGLYEGEVNGTSLVLLAHNSSGVANTTVAGGSALEDRLMYGQDGATPWNTSGFTLLKAAYNVDSGAVSSIYVFAQKDADNSYHRFMFTADHVLVKSEAMTEEQIAASALAEDPTGSYVDSQGGLFKATVLGQDFYVVGDTSGGEAAVPDLSKALFDGNGDVWAPAADYMVGGMVTNTSGGAVSTYDLYTFKMGTGLTANEVVSVQKSTWDADMNFMGTSEADPALLANVEKNAQRDLSGDSVVGFKVKTLDPASGHKGVTEAYIVNGATFLLAGQDLAVGSSTTALGLDKALLSADGSTPWAPPASEKIKFVDDRTAGDATRYVYTVNDSGAVDTAMRYEFNKTTGKLVGNGESVSLFELAQLEETKNTDINDDNYVGAVTVSVYRDDSADPSPSFGTDLLKAEFGGATFYIVNDATTGDGKLTMSGALLNQDGSAWQMPASGFTLKGVYQPDSPTAGLTAKPLEIYGLDSTGAIKQYRFAPNVDQFGARTTGYTLMDAKVNSDGVINPVQGSTLAVTELEAALDLNGDGAIGYLKGATVKTADSGSTANSWTLGKGSVSNGSGSAADEIYVVSENFEATSSISTSTDTNTNNTVAGGALWTATGTSYWKPDTGYTVTAVLSSAADQVEVWAQGTASDGSKVYQQYVFDGSGGQWLAAASSLTADADFDGDTTDDSLSTATMLGEEITATRDLNGDGAVGLKVMDRISGTGVNAYEAVVDGNTYFIVGDDSTVATGTPSAPANPATLQILKNSDGSLWNPTDPSGVQSIRVATDADITAQAGAAYTVMDGSTAVYFDSSFEKL